MKREFSSKSSFVIQHMNYNEFSIDFNGMSTRLGLSYT